MPGTYITGEPEKTQSTWVHSRGGTAPGSWRGGWPRASAPGAAPSGQLLTVPTGGQIQWHEGRRVRASQPHPERQFEGIRSQGSCRPAQHSTCPSPLKVRDEDQRNHFSRLMSTFPGSRHLEPTQNEGPQSVLCEGQEAAVIGFSPAMVFN